MVAGVNGAGKTTSIGKLAKWLASQRKSVLLAAGDTFRAAAREQLAIWGARNDVEVIAQSGGDPAAVVFDAVSAAKARGVDVLIADTAGRLPTQQHLMEELKRIKRAQDKAMPGAPHQVILIIDGTNGQNALAQVQAFDDAVGLTGLIITKLDGSAKGGVLAAIVEARRGRDVRCRFCSSASAKRSTICSRSSRAILPTPWWEPDAAGRGRPRLEQLPARDRQSRRCPHRAPRILEGNGTTGSRTRREQQAQQEVDRYRGRNTGANERAAARHEERTRARGRHTIVTAGAQSQ